jgi:hypothetical protein
MLWTYYPKSYILTNVLSRIIAAVLQISHDADCEDLLIYNTVRSDRCSSAFRRNLSPITWNLKLWNFVLRPEGIYLIWKQKAKNTHTIKRKEWRKERREKLDNEDFHDD